MAGNQADEKWSIDKLHSSNCSTWKFQMHYLLLAKGLLGYVDGTEVLREDAKEEAGSEYQRHSQQASSAIVLTIRMSQLYLVTSCNTPKDAWDALQSHFKRGTLANKLLLKKQYFQTEMREGSSIETHLK